jgi:hypothetical protein
LEKCLPLAKFHHFCEIEKLNQKKRKEQWSTMKGIYLALASVLKCDHHLNIEILQMKI